MSEAPPDTCDMDALLDEVAALDMALLRHVNAVALATTDPDTLNGLVRSQQRLARSVRTTLTTKARLAEKRKAKDGPAAADRPLGPYPWEMPAHNDVDADGDDDGEPPMDELHDAVRARIRLEYDPVEVDAIEDRLPTMIYRVWGADGYADLLPEDRLEKAMGLVRRTFRPSRTVTPKRATDAEAAKPPPPGPDPDLTPWDRHPPGARDPGGGG